MSVVVNTAIEPSIAMSGVLTFGSAEVTGLTSTASLVVGQVVKGTGLPSSTLVLSIDSTTQATLTQPAQATGATDLTFLLEPVTLAEAKKQIYLEIDNDDAMVARFIGAARRYCEVFVKRAFIATTFDAQWDSFPFGGGYYNRSLRQFYGAFPGASGATFPGFLPTGTGIIELPRPDVRSVTSVKYFDSNGTEQTMPSSNYIVQPGVPGRIAPAYGTIWPTSLPTIGAVTIRFVAGYGASADDVPDDIKSAVLLMVSHLYENRGEANVEMPQAVRHLLSSARWGSYA